ncbi:MAG: hypothetical protein QM775_21255 [Pirellulales bacterium]
MTSKRREFFELISAQKKARRGIHHGGPRSNQFLNQHDFSIPIWPFRHKLPPARCFSTNKLIDGQCSTNYFGETVGVRLIAQGLEALADWFGHLQIEAFCRAGLGKTRHPKNHPFDKVKQ